MFNFAKLAVGTAIALIIPMSQAATGPLTMLTAPDAVSRTVLAATLNRIDEGATPGVDASAAIHRNFSQIIEQNFARLSKAETTALLDNLSERELEDLAVFYNTANVDSGHQDRLLPVLATRLDSNHLVRLSHHFGYAPVYSAIQMHAPALASTFSLSATASDVAVVPHTVAALYTAPRPHAPGQFGGGQFTSNATPIARYYNWTASEVYLDLRTAPVGSLGVAGAIVETGAVYYGATKLAWSVGQTAGAALNWALQTYAPATYDTIGGTLATMYENFQQASTLLAQGQIMSSIITLVGTPVYQVTPMGNGGGDFGTCSAYSAYTQNGGSCPRGQKCPPPMEH